MYYYNFQYKCQKGRCTEFFSAVYSKYLIFYLRLIRNITIEFWLASHIKFISLKFVFYTLIWFRVRIIVPHMIFMPCEFVFYKFIGSRVRISVLHIIFCLMSLFSISLLSSQSIANQNWWWCCGLVASHVRFTNR